MAEHEQAKWFYGQIEELGFDSAFYFVLKLRNVLLQVGQNGEEKYERNERNALLQEIMT